MANKKVIVLSDVKYNGDWLRSVPQNKAVKSLVHKFDRNQIVNAWKQANGKSVRNYTEDLEVKKPTRKRTTKKK